MTTLPHNHLVCWGNSEQNQLSFPKEVERQAVAFVAAGGAHNCVILSHPNRELHCWGYNTNNQTEIPPGFERSIIQVGAGFDFTCAIKEVIVKFENACDASKQVDSGPIEAMVALKADQDSMLNKEETKEDDKQKQKEGSIACVDRPRDMSLTPNKIDNLVLQMDKIGSKLNISLRSDRGLDKDSVPFEKDHQKVKQNKNNSRNFVVTRKNFDDDDQLQHPTSVLQCFGLNSDGQTVVPQSLMTRVVLVSSGGFHSCLIKNEDQVKYSETAESAIFGVMGCWGRNEHGQSDVPAQVRQHVFLVSTGLFHSCALQATGLVKCFGLNTFMQLDSVSQILTTPVLSVAVGSLNTCVVHMQGQLECRGKSTHGVNNVPTRQAYKGQQGEESERIDLVAVGSEHVCAKKVNGTTECWGSNRYNQLDMPDTTNTNIA